MLDAVLSWKALGITVLGVCVVGYALLLVAAFLGEVEGYRRNRREGRTIWQTFFSGSDMGAFGLLAIIAYLCFNVWIVAILWWRLG